MLLMVNSLPASMQAKSCTEIDAKSFIDRDRAKWFNYLRRSVQVLNLPSKALFTGSVFFHRAIRRLQPSTDKLERILAACLFLVAKVMFLCTCAHTKGRGGGGEC